MKTKIKIKDLNSELLNLYYQDGNFNPFDTELFEGRAKFNKETGEEIGADLILTPELTNVSYISPRMESKTAEEEDTLCDAALFIQQEQTYEPDFGVKESMDTDLDFTPFITDEQKDTNFKYFMRQLTLCKNFSRLKVIRESVLTGQKGSWFFMRKEDAKKFWDAYNQKKEILNAKKAKRSA